MVNYLSLLTLAFLASLTSCRKFEQEKVIAEAEPYAPKNLYPIERLPTYFNRVALMPCFYPDSASSILEFADDAFYRELSQARLFEVVQITPEVCKELFGQPRFSSSHPLPSDFYGSACRTHPSQWSGLHRSSLLQSLQTFESRRPLQID